MHHTADAVPIHFVRDPAARPEPTAGGQKGRFHAMAKPIGSTCNIDCAYCYYLHKEQLLDQKRGRRMAPSMLERYIRQYIESQNGEQIVFSWQGGEPTMLGLDFFRDIVALQEKYQPAGQRIENDLQTNATLLTDEWCRFLKQQRFLMGVSIDGPRALHDAYRVDRKGQPTFDAVMRGIALLKRHDVQFNTLTVVNPRNAKRPLDVYRFLRDEVGSTYTQFIPCVEPKDFRTVAPQHWPIEAMPVVGSSAAHPGQPESVVTDWSVDPDDWGYFLSRTFDEWSRRWECRPSCASRRNSAARRSPSNTTERCTHATTMPTLPTRWATSAQSTSGRWRSRNGNGNSVTQSAILCPATAARAATFHSAGGNVRRTVCCAPEGEPGLNYLCSGIRTFHGHAGSRIREIAEQLRK